MRTPGSGWGAGPILWQVCPGCGKKKCFYDPINDSASRYYKPFRCVSKECKTERRRYDSDTLIKKTHK